MTGWSETVDGWVRVHPPAPVSSVSRRKAGNVVPASKLIRAGENVNSLAKTRARAARPRLLDFKPVLRGNLFDEFAGVAECIDAAQSPGQPLAILGDGG